MIGSLASFPLPDSMSETVPTSPLYSDPLQDELLKQFNIEVPIIPWPSPPKHLLRIAAQLYNEPEQYVALASGIKTLIER
jgi:isopenicillin-N epimerase